MIEGIFNIIIYIVTKTVKYGFHAFKVVKITQICRCFTLFSDWIKFHREHVIFKKIFRRNGYPKSFIENCFKKFSDLDHI